MPLTLHVSKEWKLVNHLTLLIRPSGAVAVIFGLVILGSYLLGIEWVYRPIANGPATHPLTALCITLIGFIILRVGGKQHAKWIDRILLLCVIGITCTRFLDGALHTHISALITPFQDIVASQIKAGKSNSMGLNTALMFFVIILSLVFHSFKKLSLSQVFGYIAIAIPCVSFTGYIYGLENYYGEMSLVTSAAGILLAISTLALTAHHGVLKAVLSPYTGGIIARFEIIASLIVPTLLGYIFIYHVGMQSKDFLGIFIISVCWFFILMAGISAKYNESIDSDRREKELMLIELATNDSLTGVYNRRKFLEYTTHEIEHIKRNGSTLWIAMLDIDNFKKINDTAGHAIGDKVLVAVAKTLQNSVRVGDVVSRIGGEEFCILLLDADSNYIEKIAEKIRANIENLSIPGWTDLYGPVTVSIGCSQNDGGCTLDQSLNCADQALYKSKDEGRNRVSIVDVVDTCGGCKLRKESK